MKLIAGLGNPGEQYARTRHNAGFMVVDELARSLGLAWQNQPKFKSLVATGEYQGEKLILLKPQTFMNLSGSAIQAAAAFYKVMPTDTWVVFDDVDTPFGRLRIRQGGSGSGHQGVNSTITHVGDSFWRIKFGISLNDRTREPSEVYVLKPFNEDEREQLPQVVPAAARIIEDQLQKTEPEATSFHLV